jgi:AcrR family transcriptional regulator
MILGEMTNSQTRAVQGKPERLVAGARQVLHRQGVEKTTLADIAQASDVPVGNVYYYFQDQGAARLMQLPIDWAEQQFRLMGRRDARDLAFALIAAYHGIALLTNTFPDPQLMTREARRLERWIDSLA